MAPKRINGRLLPQRVSIRSLIMPMSGSLMLSHNLPTSTTVPANAGFTPTTLVKNTNQNAFRAVVAADAPQSPAP